ncbi:MAG: hypothetical protein AMK72_08905 [Planctomycetes bacterium SM23_25]|nr:MAG: hypothetical protein AMK72_08905 [Planctomycetes bacterium SM23_25]
MVALQSAAQALPDAGRPMADLLLEPWANLLKYHPLVAAVLLVPVGIAFLLYGFRLYRWLVVIAYVGIGVVVGMAAALYLDFSQPAGIMVGAIVLGVLAWPLHRVAWGILGGVLFAVIFVEVADVIEIRGSTPLFLIGAVAFVAGMALTVLLMKPLIVVITSLVGATFVAVGTLSLTMAWPTLGGPVDRVINARPYVPVVIVLLLAFVGSILQLIDTGDSKKKRKKQRSSDDG